MTPCWLQRIAFTSKQYSSLEMILTDIEKRDNGVCAANTFSASCSFFHLAVHCSFGIPSVCYWKRYGTVFQNWFSHYVLISRSHYTYICCIYCLAKGISFHSWRFNVVNQIKYINGTLAIPCLLYTPTTVLLLTTIMLHNHCNYIWISSKFFMPKE